jgi:hypothetical protein
VIRCNVDQSDICFELQLAGTDPAVVRFVRSAGRGAGRGGRAERFPGVFAFQRHGQGQTNVGETGATRSLKEWWETGKWKKITKK